MSTFGRSCIVVIAALSLPKEYTLDLSLLRFYLYQYYERHASSFHKTAEGGRIQNLFFNEEVVVEGLRLICDIKNDSDSTCFDLVP